MARWRRARTRKRQKSLQNRQREPSGLSGSGLRGCHHIAAGHHHRDCGGLDRSGRSIAHLGNCTLNRLSERKVCEGNLCQFFAGGRNVWSHRLTVGRPDALGLQSGASREAADLPLADCTLDKRARTHQGIRSWPWLTALTSH